jgi:uncharacterized membrane protein YeiB
MGRHHDILIIYAVVGMISAIILNRFVQKGWLIFGYYLIVGLIIDRRGRRSLSINSSVPLFW